MGQLLLLELRAYQRKQLGDRHAATSTRMHAGWVTFHLQPERTMSEHNASIRWSRGNHPFTYDGYSRDHQWSFDGGQTLVASAAQAYLGSAEGVDPDEALVAALSSCHMLTLLAIAAKKGWVVESYEDDAVGTLAKGANGRLAVTGVVLRPHIVFSGDKLPDDDALQRLHHQSHEHCFIANSVRTEISIEPR